MRVAKGLEPADAIIINVNLVEVNTGSILEGVSILIKGRRIAGVLRTADVSKYRGSSTLVINGKGFYAMPGFIDLHVHIESSMLDPIGFSKLALLHGTTTIVADPHEVVNVLGLRGFEVFAEAAKKTPLKILLELPSCVPPVDPKLGLETPASKFDVEDMEKALHYDNVVGLGEVMDFISVVNGELGIHEKIKFVDERGLIIDGHAPLLSTEDLNAYISAGIESDHETTNLEEAYEKAWRGMYLFIREGSAWMDLEALIDIVKKTDCKLCAFVSDDVGVVDLYEKGHMDRIINKAISLGLDPVKAIQLATINPAIRLHLEKHIGIIAPGRLGDIVLSRRIDVVKPITVLANGEVTVYNGSLVKEIGDRSYPAEALSTVKLNLDFIEKMEVAPRVSSEHGSRVRVNTIEVKPGSALTKHVVEELDVRNGRILPDLSKDIIYVGVVYRHSNTGEYSVGFLKGLSFKPGGIAQTVAHDTHNIIFAGWREKDIKLAIKRVYELQGGIVVVDNGKIISEVELKLAGLMSIKEPDVVYREYKELIEKAREYGAEFEPVFMTLSLVSLPVIPELRITSKGLVEVMSGKVIPLVVE